MSGARPSLRRRTRQPLPFLVDVVVEAGGPQVAVAGAPVEDLGLLVKVGVIFL